MSPAPAAAPRSVGWALLLPLLAAPGCAIQVVDSAISEDAKSYWVRAVQTGTRDEFTTEDERVTLSVRLAPNFIGAFQRFQTVWIDPDNKIHARAVSGTVRGSHQDLIVFMRIRGTPAARKPGEWQVKVFLGQDLLVHRRFTIREPGAGG